MSSAAFLFRTAKLEGIIIQCSSHKQIVSPICCWASLATNIKISLSAWFQQNLKENYPYVRVTGAKKVTHLIATFFLNNKSFYTLHDFIISVTPAGLSWNKLARKDYKTTTFFCVFLNKEITSYNKNIVQLIFQFCSVNSRNLSPLTESTCTKTIERTTSLRKKIGARPYKVTKPRTSELVNLLFSRQDGIQSVSICFRLRLTNWWS